MTFHIVDAILKCSKANRFDDTRFKLIFYRTRHTASDRDTNLAYRVTKRNRHISPVENPDPYRRRISLASTAPADGVSSEFGSEPFGNEPLVPFRQGLQVFRVVGQSEVAEIALKPNTWRFISASSTHTFTYIHLRLG